MIRVISGVCDTELGLKRSTDGPFTLSPEAEKRLVDRNVAEYVYKPVATAEARLNAVETGVTKPASETIATGLGIVDSGETHYLDKGQLAEMSFAELKSLAKDMGISCGSLRSKNEYIEAIAAVPVGLGEEVFPDTDSEDIVV